MPGLVPGIFFVTAKKMAGTSPAMMIMGVCLWIYSSSRCPSCPARSWMYCHATRPERLPRVACPSMPPARSLSGGNLQKFIVGREIDAQPRVLLLSQPTWGVDVGAAAHIRAAVLGLREAGCAVLVVSEELDELFALCDGLHVMAQGRLSPRIDREQADVALIGSWMSGLWDQPAGMVN